MLEGVWEGWEGGRRGRLVGGTCSSCPAWGAWVRRAWLGDVEARALEGAATGGRCRRWFCRSAGRIARAACSWFRKCLCWSF